MNAVLQMTDLRVESLGRFICIMFGHGNIIYFEIACLTMELKLDQANSMSLVFKQDEKLASKKI